VAYLSGKEFVEVFREVVKDISGENWKPDDETSEEEIEESRAVNGYIKTSLEFIPPVQAPASPVALQQQPQKEVFAELKAARSRALPL